MPTYNLLEYSDNYFMKSGCLSNYQRDEVNDDTNDIDATDNNNQNNKKVATSRSFDAEAELPLINCEVQLHLSWLRKCVMSEIYKTLQVPTNPAGNPSTDRLSPRLTFDATFQIKSTRLYVLIVTLFINNNIKFLENLKQGFRGKLIWNKYRYKITTQP